MSRLELIRCMPWEGQAYETAPAAQGTRHRGHRRLGPPSRHPTRRGARVLLGARPAAADGAHIRSRRVASSAAAPCRKSCMHASPRRRARRPPSCSARRCRLPGSARRPGRRRHSSGLVGLFVAATGLVYQAQMALAHVFEWERGGGVKHTLVLRALGLGAIVVPAALTVALFAAIAVLDALDAFARVNGLATGAAFAAVALAATLMSYHWLSGRRVPWDAAFAGAGSPPWACCSAATCSRSTCATRKSVRSTAAQDRSSGSCCGSTPSRIVYLVGAEVARAWMVVRERTPAT